MCSRLIQRKIDFLKKSIIPFIITVILFMVFFSFYKVIYAINDDLMIESVLSGSYYDIYPYTYYLSVPLGTIISTLYALAGGIPWLGVCLFLCLFISVFAMEYVAVVRVEKVKHKIVAVIFTCIFVTALLSSAIVLPHYTVVAATVGAAGIILFMTATDERQFIAPIVFFVLTYLIRENVFFMLIPFVGIVFIYLIITNRGCNLKGYFIYALGFFAASLVVIVLNRSLLTSEEWSHYREFNDVRTEVYDYVGTIQSDEAFEYYESKGYSREDVELIISYNILLSDSDMTAGALRTIADYAYMKLDEMGTGSRLKDALVTYKYRMVPRGADFPYNYLVIGLYIVAFVLIILNRRLFQLIPLIMCGIYRTAIWMYLIYKGRYPERVTLSLFIMEISLLVCMVARSVYDTKKKKTTSNLKTSNLKTSNLKTCESKTNEPKTSEPIAKESATNDNIIKIIKGISVVGVMGAFLLGSLLAVKKLNVEYKTVTDTNSQDDVLYSYMYDHPDEFYYLDVYATVARTKPVFEVSSFSRENYMILGGWLVEHPLCKQKILSTGYESVCDALRSDRGYHIVIKDGVGASEKQLSQWIGAEAKCVDSIEAGDTTFYVYSFSE